MFNSNNIKNHILKIENKYGALSSDFSAQQKFHEEPHHIKINEKGHFFLDKEGLIQLNKVIKEIMTNPDVKNNFTRKEIKENVLNIVLDSLIVEKEKREKNITNNLELLKNELGEAKKEWTFFVSVENISINQNFKIGDVELLNKEGFNEIFEEKYKDADEGYKDHVRRLSPSHEVIAKTTVNGTKNQMKRHALKKIRLALNLINFYKNENELGAGLANECVTSNIKSYFYYSDDGLGYEWGPATQYNLISINDHRIKEMEDKQYNELEKLLVKENLSQLERNIMLAVFWVGESTSTGYFEIKDHIYINLGKKEGKLGNLEHSNLSKKLLFLFMALETLLNFNNSENISENISDRVAFLGGKCSNHKHNLKSRIKELYTIRSKIAHGNDMFVSNDDVKYLEKTTKSIILILLNLVNKYRITKNDELGSLFNIMKFEGHTYEKSILFNVDLKKLKNKKQ